MSRISWLRMRGLIYAIFAIIVLAQVPARTAFADDAFTWGGLTIVHWGTAQEIKGTFWVRPGQDAKPLTFAVVNSGESSIQWHDLTIAGPEKVDAGVSANYTITIKKSMDPGTHHLTLKAQSPNGQQDLTVTVIVLKVGEATRSDSKSWVVPLTLSTPTGLDNVKYQVEGVLSASRVEAVEVDGKPASKPLSLGPDAQELRLVLPDVKAGAYKVPVTATGTNGSASFLVPVTIPGLVVTAPADGKYTLEFAAPFLTHWLYYLRNFGHLPEPTTAATMQSDTLYDQKRHRKFPDGQLKLLESGGDEKGTAYVLVTNQGNPQELTLAVQPNTGIRPGSYQGNVTIGGVKTPITINVRHSLTWVLVVALAVFFLPRFLLWLNQQSKERKDLWEQLHALCDLFQTPPQPKFFDHLCHWVAIDICRWRVPKELIQKKLALGHEIASKPEWKPLLGYLDDFTDPHEHQFWSQLRQSLRQLPGTFQPASFQTMMSKAMQDAGVDNNVIANLPTVPVTEGRGDGAQPVVTAQSMVDVLISEKLIIDRLLWSIQTGLTGVMKHSDWVVALFISTGAFVGVVWQAYQQFSTNPTFGADLFSDYGKLLGTVLGVKVIQSLLSKLAPDTNTK